jgi:hypothetical protein
VSLHGFLFLFFDFNIFSDQEIDFYSDFRGQRTRIYLYN